MSSSLKKPLIVGITGASGAVYGVRLLEMLNTCGIETHLIVSRAAQLTLAYETDLKLSDLEKLAWSCIRTMTSALLVRAARTVRWA